MAGRFHPAGAEKQLRDLKKMLSNIGVKVEISTDRQRLSGTVGDTDFAVSIDDHPVGECKGLFVKLGDEEREAPLESVTAFAQELGRMAVPQS